MDLNEEAIIKAIKDGKYEISYDEPNMFEECRHPDGSVFYRSHSDSCRFGTDNGCCIVEVLSTKFVYSWLDCYWTVDDEELENENIIEALESLDGVLVTDGYVDDDFLLKAYALANGMDPNGNYEYYFPDCGDWPVDYDSMRKIEDLDLREVKFKRKTYFVLDDEERESEFERYAVQKGVLPDDYGVYPCVILTFDENDVDRAVRAIHEKFMQA